MADAPIASIFDVEPPNAHAFLVERRNCAARFILRGTLSLKAAGLAFGTTIPNDAQRAVRHDRRAALWLGPDEWLLLAGDGDPALLQAHLETAIGPAPHALVEVTHRQQAVIVSGTAVEQALNVAVPLDLSLAAFPVDRCTRTIFEKIEIVLWRRSEQCFHIETGRSFMPYLREYLALISDEFGGSGP